MCGPDAPSQMLIALRDIVPHTRQLKHPSYRKEIGLFLSQGGAEGGDDFFCEEVGLGFFVADVPEDEGVHAQVVIVVGELYIFDRGVRADAEEGWVVL